MFQNWLKPIDQEFTSNPKEYTNSQIGANIKAYIEDFPALDDIKIALIGIDHVAMNKVRTELYNYANIETPVADIGNKHNTESSSLVQVFAELTSSNIIPIFVGCNIEFVQVFLRAYSSSKKEFNACLVEPSVPPTNKMTNYFEAIYGNQFQNLKQLGIIGHQTHCSDQKLLDGVGAHKKALRLGEFRTQTSFAEPILRDSDFLCFNIEAMRHGEVCGQSNNLPSGLTAEEACQIMRFAGISDRISSIGILGFDIRKDINNQIPKLVAEMIWYFLDGFTERKMDYPILKKNMQQFVVDLKACDTSISFWKSHKSGRWWVEIPGEYNDEQLLSCNYNDYRLACKDEISPQLMELLQTV